MTEESIARVEALAGWFVEHEVGGHSVSNAAAKEYAADLRAILSERAELLAAVERMRGTLEEADRRLSRPDWTVQRDVTRMAIRAALTTGEATSTEQGERG